MFVVVGVPFYFQNRLQDIPKDQEAIPFINSLTAKLSAFIIIALYTMSFLSFQLKNSGYSKVGFCSCIFSFFLLYAFRGKIISQIREIPANPKERFQRSLRSLLAMSLLYGIYFSLVQFLIPHTGILPAVVIAIIFITYSAPLFVRIWMPSQKMHNSTIKQEIMQIFESANNPVHEVFLIDTDRFKSYNALVCGPKYGFGPFKRSVFVTKNLFEVLEPEEIRAVICHEAAHFKLHHVFKRGCMSVVGMLVSLFCVFLPITFISTLMRMPIDKNYAFLIISTLATIVIQFIFMFRVIRKQEFEADLEAINIGSTAEALSTALTKITDKNGGSRKKADWISRFMFGSAHPHLEERLLAVSTNKIPEDSNVLPAWKYTVSYASIVIALGAFAIMDFDGKKQIISNREVASVTSAKTGQILPTVDNKFERSQKNAER